MKYLKTYEGYGGRSGPSQIDCDEIKTINDVPESYMTKFYENRELTPHEKSLVKDMFNKYTSVVIPEDVIMDRLSDIRDITQVDEIIISNKVYYDGESISLTDVDKWKLHDLIRDSSRLKFWESQDEKPYAISSVDITFPIKDDTSDSHEFREDLVDKEAFIKANDMLNKEIKEFFENYADCEVDVDIESYNTTMGILIRYK